MRFTRIGVGWRSSGIASIALVLTGCASQGPLQPPSLHLPQLAQNVTAERVGDRVELTWTTPATTTDGVKMKGAMTANICVDNRPSGAALATTPSKTAKKRARNSAAASNPSACNVVQHLAVSPGAGKADVELGVPLAAGTPRAIAYSVELLNERGKSAGQTAPAFVAAGAAPPATGDLKISARRESAVVEWQADSASAVVELKRTLVATSAGPVSDAPQVKPSKSPTPFSPAAKQPPRELVLRPDASGKDAGGMVDASVREGDTYTYVAQRVETLTLAGHPLEMRSAPSPVATFTYHDVFPPKAPTGLVLVPGGGFGEPPSIDLSWDANLENDVVGYNIYRSSGADIMRVNTDPISVPSFHDVRVEPGQQYTYRVTAVDQRHNESAPGTSATETLRK